MIWQETNGVAVIVMLTQTEEAGKEKCFQYFPLDADAGPFRIEPIDGSGGTPEGKVEFLEISTDKSSNTAIRKLLLTFGDEQRVVWHLLFCGWPDFAVPEGENCEGLLKLIELSVKKNHVPKNPRIIHCSAGVGRSGTFIALEYLLRQLKSGAVSEAKDEEDMVHEVVNRLREQRMSMVQGDAQYSYLYRVLREQLDLLQTRTEADLESEEPSPKIRKVSKGIKPPQFDDAAGDETVIGINQGKAPNIT